MATVYKAKCHVLKRFVAVKVLRDEYTTDAEFIKRFNIEAQSAASLTHPNIVSVYDVGNEENLYYIVMELVQGKTLKEIIVEDGALSWKWSTNIAIQIASALDMAHKNNIIHRDIKPHNIIITEDGIAKVTDFGIAKAVSNSTITAFGTTIGSVHYFSPEHARGGYTDAKSDLYSLGVVLYEMVTGKVPFDADTPVSVALKHMQEEAIAPIKLNPAIPKGLNDIIVKAMKKDVNERYATASEMLKDLNAVLKNPNGDTVVLNNTHYDSPTQKIPLMYNNRPLHEKVEAKDREIGRREKNKKENKVKQFFKEHTIMKFIAIFLACVLVFLLTMGITFAVVNAGKPKNVKLPQVVGVTVDEAKQIAEKLNLTVEVIEEKYSAEVETGKIISQEPKFRENYDIKEGNIIKVIISKGIEVTKVPGVVAVTKDEARLTLRQQGFEVEEVEEKSDKIEAGYIIKQEPAEGTEVEAKSTVKIFVSIGTGIEQVVVPEVIGKSEEEAKQILTNAKLTVASVKTETDTTQEDGKIIRQSIDPGKTVDENTAVTLTMNVIPKIKTGTVNVNVKSFTGYTVKKDEEGKTITPKKVEVMIKVGDDDVVWQEKHSEDLEKLTVSVQGMGVITVRTYISGVLKSTNQLNLNDATPVLNVSN